MMLSLKAIYWLKIKHITFIIYSTSALLASTIANGLVIDGRQKRQLFREHVLPEYTNGKIPDGALSLDRINLNNLNQRGFFNVNGIYFDQIQPNRRHLLSQYQPNTLKVKVQSYPNPNRYTAPPGRCYLPQPQQVFDTTYIKEPFFTNYAFFPKPRSVGNLPYLPETSLKLVRRYKYHKFNQVLNPKNERIYLNSRDIAWDQPLAELPTFIQTSLNHLLLENNFYNKYRN